MSSKLKQFSKWVKKKHGIKEDTVEESIVTKAKRIIDKALGNQQKRIHDKVNTQMDDRQVKLLGHKYKDTNDDIGAHIQDGAKLRGDERYNSLNRRFNYTEPLYGKGYREGLFSANKKHGRKSYLGMTKEETVQEGIKSALQATRDTTKTYAKDYFKGVAMAAAVGGITTASKKGAAMGAAAFTAMAAKDIVPDLKDNYKTYQSINKSKKPVKEETINELSTKKLIDYTKRASKDSAKKQDQGNKIMNKHALDDSKKGTEKFHQGLEIWHKGHQREKSANLAAKKIGQKVSSGKIFGEETISEISLDKTVNYMAAATTENPKKNRAKGIVLAMRKAAGTSKVPATIKKNK